ncbi:VanW family protein [Clostridium uliginosum]|uniref:Vancomycin resistance protein YoaR, contains peptidoglycan-binding and VanW domains n=1 Tax=Clostridium uliginosum TaxID=119641 RepID=A0A1I1NLA3_9CLOT|nr:VanW family protein [Clostridium uliginosum]SFC94530.1 Vancomycin resistance protein YoaR, contains peptidoglycan-binding and VanW domains [Clostridium uliginosum]
MNEGRGKRGHILRRSDNNKKKKIILGTAVAAVIIGASLMGYSLSIKGIVKEWDQKIYSGVTIEDIDLGGMTKEEAKEELTKTLEGSIGDKKLPIKIGDNEYELIYSDISPTYDIDAAVEEAYFFGKEHGLFRKYLCIKNETNHKIPINIGFTYDEEKLKAYEETLKNKITQNPTNATISASGSGFSIKDEVVGKSINIETLDQKLKETINGNINDNSGISVDLETVQPKVTKAELSKVNGLMGSFSSNYGTSGAGRSTNIEIATKAINGTVLMPGEVFSFNEVVGPRTVERGYQEAGTYVANKVEPGIGGGICQVSTALYRAMMHANIRSVERRNHSMVVGYAQPGLDATVSYGDIDYKFKNTYDFPIYIEGTTYNKVINYNIYGDVSGLGGKTYDMVNEITQTIPPQVKVVPDPSLPEGKEVSEGAGMTGYKANGYQVTYENGVQANKELISTDYYSSVDVTVKKGTQPAVPVAPTEPPVVPTEPQVTPTEPPVAPPAQ